MTAFRRAALVMALATSFAAHAQMGQTLGYQWVEAVRNEDPVKLNKLAAERSRLNAAVLDYQLDGEGAIHVAVKKGNTEYLRFMLGLGANPNLISGRDGETPLTLAVVVDQPALVAALLARGARVDQGNRSGETPLIKAVRFHRQAMVQELLTRGADPDKADYTGKSARLYAAGETRFPQIAKALADAPRRTAKPVAGPQLR